jgi:hypothetical protein
LTRSHDARNSSTHLSRSCGICLPRASFVVSLTASSNNSPQKTGVCSRIFCLWRWKLEITHFADVS